MADIVTVQVTDTVTGTVTQQQVVEVGYSLPAVQAVPLPSGTAAVGKVPTVTQVSPLALGWGDDGDGTGTGTVTSVNDVDPDDSGNVTLTAADVASVSVTGGGKETIGALGNVTGSATVNLADGNVFTAAMTGATTFTFTGATSGVACSFTLYLSQDATGGRVATWPGSVTWIGGTPTPSTAVSALNVYVFETLNGGTTWYGSLVQALPALPLSIADGGTGQATAAAAILALLAGGVTLPAYIAPKVETLTGTSPAINTALANVFVHQLTGDTTYPAPSNPLPGQKIEFHTQQPSSGGPYTVTFATGSAGDYSGGAGSIPAASTSANAVDFFAFTYDANAGGGTGRWCCLNSGGLGY